MTTIAWCGRFLAADSLRSRNGTRMGHYPKIHAKAADGEFYHEEDGRRLAFALTGFPAHREQWIAWYVNGQGKDDVPHTPNPNDLGGWFIVLREGDKPLVRICSLETPYLVELDEGPHAWGSGGDLALGAMLAGKSALEAVAIACGPRGDTGTGGPIRFLDMQNWDLGVQDYGRDLATVVKELRTVKCDWAGPAGGNRHDWASGWAGHPRSNPGMARLVGSGVVLAQEQGLDMTEAQYIQTIRTAAEGYLEAIRDPAAFRGAADEWTRRIQYWAAIKDKLSPNTMIDLCDLWLETNGGEASQEATVQPRSLEGSQG